MIKEISLYVINIKCFASFLSFFYFFVRIVDSVNPTHYHKHTVTDSNILEKNHIGADLVLGGFASFVIFMIFFHCYLRRKHKKYLEKVSSYNVYRFEWEQEDHR